MILTEHIPIYLEKKQKSLLSMTQGSENSEVFPGIL